MRWDTRLALPAAWLLPVALLAASGPLRAGEPEEPAPKPEGIYANRRMFGTGQAPGGAGGTNRHAESAAMAGLVWLALAQEQDGRWDCKRWGGSGNFDVGVTGLALLAFLGAGYTHTKGKFMTTLENGLRWLSTNQKDDGSFRWNTFYEQGIATMAVSEAHALTRSPFSARRAQMAIDYICKVQPDHGGFRYGGAVPKDEGDLSVSSWQLMALKTALAAGLKVPDQAIERSRLLLKNTLRERGGSAYLVSTPNPTPAMTAAGMLARQFLGGDDADILAAANWLRQHQQNDPQVGPGTGKDHLVGDLYYTYYSTLAMFQMGGEHWAEWNKAFRDPLVKCQVHEIADAKGLFIRGSWDPANHLWARQAGRVYATAMAVLCLEAYYRYCPVYRAQKPTAF